MRRRGAGLSSSPVLVGAVTVLVTLVAVVISYSANEGLPFVPTYQIKAQVPNAAKLVEGNDVRAGRLPGRSGHEDPGRAPAGGRSRSARSPSSSSSWTRRWSRCRWTRRVTDPLALGARAQVRGAGAGTVRAQLPGGRHDPAAARRHRAGGPRGPALDLPAGDAGRRPPGPAGLRQRTGRPRSRPQPDDRGAAPVRHAARARDARPVGQAHRAARALPGAGPDAPAGRPGGRRPGRVDR